MSDFGNLTVQIAKEYRLLKRFADTKAATNKDAERISELEGILEDLRCPFCGTPFLKHEEQE